MGDSDDDCIFQENSQPLFTEVQNENEFKRNAYIDNSNGTKHSSDEIYDMSQSLLLPTTSLTKRRRLQENDDQDVQEKDKMDNCDGNKEKIPDKCEQNTQDLFEKVNEKHSANEITLENNSEDNSEVQCIHCTFDKELDKRNYYFGNSLIGELQLLPPCMRSNAYINILKYIDALKHKHINKRSDY